jgi:1,2-diacylglycerol 3-alpha-glucosyltransferase
LHYCYRDFEKPAGSRSMSASDEKKPLTIAMVVASAFPTNQGTQVSIKQMSQILGKRGHNVHVVCYHIGDSDPTPGFTLHRIPPLINYSKFRSGPSFQKPFLDFLVTLKLYQVVKRERVDVIHAHNYEAPLAGYLVRLLTGVPVIYHGHNLMSDELHQYFESPFARAVFRRLGPILDKTIPRFADYAIGITGEVADYLSTRGVVRPDRLAVIPLGMFCDDHRKNDPGEIRKKHNLKEEEKVVLYNGNCDKYQNVPYLLEAMAHVFEKVPDARLAFITNDLENWVVEWVRENGFSGRTLFVESDSFQCTAEFYSIADVAVSPRTSCPGIPIKLLSYMEARVPIVAFEGSAKNLAHEKHCLAVKNGDVRGLADAVIRLLGNPALAEKLRNSAFQLLKAEYDWTEIAGRIEEIYRRVIDGKRKPGRLGTGRSL